MVFSGLAARFIRFGQRSFTPTRTFGRVAFSPILYLLLWAGALRITVNAGAVDDIPFRQNLAGWTDVAWDALALGCPPLALLAWWMITRGGGHAKLRGQWLRLAADFGMFVSLLTYHIATALATPTWSDDATAYARYLTAACIVFLAALVVRDVWALIVINRVAAGIRDGRFT